jgi:hypothetical protein
MRVIITTDEANSSIRKLFLRHEPIPLPGTTERSYLSVVPGSEARINKILVCFQKERIGMISAAFPYQKKRKLVLG